MGDNGRLYYEKYYQKKLEIKRSLLNKSKNPSSNKPNEFCFENGIRIITNKLKRFTSKMIFDSLLKVLSKEQIQEIESILIIFVENNFLILNLVFNN